MRHFVWSLFTFLLLVSPKAFGLEVSGNRYFEVCLSGTDRCTVGVFTKFGQFAALIRESQPLPGYHLGDIFQVGPSGDLVATLREADYQRLVAAGLERTYHSADITEAEIQSINDEMSRNTQMCAIGSFVACVGGPFASAGMGPFGWGIAFITCYGSGLACQSLGRTNNQLKKERAELEKKLKEENDKVSGGATSSAGGGGGREGTSGLHGGTTTIWEGAPHPGGTATITDPPNGHAFGGGVPIQPGSHLE